MVLFPVQSSEQDRRSNTMLDFKQDFEELRARV